MMRFVFAGCRQTLLRSAASSRLRANPQSLANCFRAQRCFASGWRPSAARVFARRTAAAGLLTPLALVSIADEEEQNGKSSEDRMLEASREELQLDIPQDVRGLRRFWWQLTIWFDCYVFEPLATGLRFLHLTIIFTPVLFTAPLIWLGPQGNKHDPDHASTFWWYRFLVRSMERAGPAFIKLGQWAASRADIFPTALCQELSKLHSNAPAHSLETTKRTIVRAFKGRPFEEIFEEFEEKPLGVGAIAQVYKAKLKPDLAASSDTDVRQEEPKMTQRVRKNVDVLVKSTPQRVPSSYVAVKVLHPKVERTVRRDLRIMSFFAHILNIIPTLEWLSFPDEVKQFGKMMYLQLDLRIEAANLTEFRKNFKDRSTAWFPYPYSDYTTRQVLIEEYAHGIPLAHFLEQGGGVFQHEIADEGLDAFLRMLLIDNFIHADLHPGNIMVRFYKPQQLDLAFTKSQEPQEDEKHGEETERVLDRLRACKHDGQKWTQELQAISEEGFQPQLIFIDAGLVTSLNAKNRTNFLDLFKAVAEFDGYRAGHLMVERCRQPEAVIDTEVFALRMQHLVLSVKSRTFALGNVKIEDILHEVLSMVRNHHVRLEGDFVNVVVSILLLEGIGRQLDPDLDLLKSALPILRQMGAKQGGASLIQSARKGDFSMLKVWVGLEARKYLQGSVEDVERCVRYDLLSPNI